MGSMLITINLAAPWIRHGSWFILPLEVSRCAVSLDHARLWLHSAWQACHVPVPQLTRGGCRWRPCRRYAERCMKQSWNIMNYLGLKIIGTTVNLNERPYEYEMIFKGSQGSLKMRGSHNYPSVAAEWAIKRHVKYSYRKRSWTKSLLCKAHNFSWQCCRAALNTLQDPEAQRCWAHRGVLFAGFLPSKGEKKLSQLQHLLRQAARHWLLHRVIRMEHQVISSVKCQVSSDVHHAGHASCCFLSHWTSVLCRICRERLGYPGILKKGLCWNLGAIWSTTPTAAPGFAGYAPVQGFGVFLWATICGSYFATKA